MSVQEAIAKNATTWEGQWNIDPIHSKIQFAVSHMVISEVTGVFKDFEGGLTFTGEGFDLASAAFSAKVDSISTDNEQRDGHLKSDDFFNAEAYPALTYKSTNIQVTGDNTFEVEGHMTIRDVTKPVTLQVKFGGMVKDAYGQYKAGFAISGAINRKEFGLKWSALTEAGGMVVGNEVRLHLNVQLAKVVED